MIIPKHLESLVDISKEEDGTFKLSVNKAERFEVYYSGTLEKIDDVMYITSDPDIETANVERVFIKEKDADSMYVVYDGLIHGYDNLFCNEHNLEIDRPLKQLELDGFKLFEGEITLGYGIDFDDEKEDYDMDEDGMQHVYNREEKMSWEEVKAEGFDWITIKFANEAGNSIFLDLELA